MIYYLFKKLTFICPVFFQQFHVNSQTLSYRIIKVAYHRIPFFFLYIELKPLKLRKITCNYTKCELTGLACVTCPRKLKFYFRDKWFSLISPWRVLGKLERRIYRAPFFFSLFHANILQSFWPLLLIGSDMFLYIMALLLLRWLPRPGCPNVVQCHQKSTPLAEVSFQHACKHLLRSRFCRWHSSSWLVSLRNWTKPMKRISATGGTTS